MVDREPEIEVTVVIPTCSGRREVSHTLPELLAHLPAASEVLLVINSEDPSARARASQAAGQHPGVRVISTGQQLGKGGAILLGLRQARGRVIGFVDDDIPFPPPLVAQRLIRPVMTGSVDCAVASKWLGREYREVDTYTLRSKKLLSRALNLATRHLFGLPFADTQGGAKFFTRAAFEGLGEEFTCPGFEFDVELLWRLTRAGAIIQEAHLPAGQARGSTFHLRDSMIMALNLLRLLLKGSARGR